MAALWALAFPMARMVAAELTQTSWPRQASVVGTLHLEASPEAPSAQLGVELAVSSSWPLLQESDLPQQPATLEMVHLWAPACLLVTEELGRAHP